MEPLADWLAVHRTFARNLARSVILLELFFPLCVVLPAPLFFAVLGAGAIFHVSIAISMGLHGFFWSFVATYPAFYFARERLAELLFG